MIEPEATGFIPATDRPRRRQARSSAALARVLPTPVSVPVTKKSRRIVNLPRPAAGQWRRPER